MDRGQQYLRNIGNKFTATGEVRPFPGNTVISFIDHAAPVFALFCEVRKLLADSVAGECFTFLPDDSIHMTVFEGVCDQWRQAAVWTSLLPLDAPLAEVDALFEKQFLKAPPLGDVRMRADKVKSGGGYGIALSPCEKKDAQSLAAYRDTLNALTGIRFPNHETYGYHISICYGVKAPVGAQNAALDRFEREANALIAEKRTEFAVRAPQMTYFRNMFAFEPHRFARP